MMYTLHIIPGIAAFVNAYITDCVLSRNLLKTLVVFAVSYIFINFIQTKVNGEPVYPFLHWKSMETPIISAVLIIFFGFFYFIMCSIDENIKDQRIKKNSKKMN